MHARLIGLIVVFVLAAGATALPGTSDPPGAREWQPASAVKFDGNPQAEWHELLDSAVGLEPVWEVAEAWGWVRAKPSALPELKADVSLSSVLVQWAGAVWTAVTTVVQAILAVRASL